MSVSVEKLDHNMAKLTVELPTEKFEESINRVYNKQKSRIQIPGFRKGKAPRQLVEKMYGADIFFQDAADDLVSREYPNVYEECELDIVSAPKIDVTQMEKGKPFIFTAEVATRPEVELGKYKGVTVTKIDTSVSDEEVEKDINSTLEKNARTDTVDRPAENGDTTVIDFEGFKDGVAFEGGKGEDYSLVLGSHSFIEGFEDQLVGKSAGDDVEVNVTFPENYQEKSLAGQPATFNVKVKEVKAKILPTLDDEYVADTTEYSTVDEYKASVREKLEKVKEDQAKRTKEDEAIEKIIKDSKMDIPDAMVDTQINEMINEYARSLAQSGLSFQQYLQYTGEDLNKFKEHVKPDALERIKSSLVLQQVAKEENLVGTDEDVDDKIKEAAEQNKMTFEDLSKNVSNTERETMKEQISIEKAIDFIMENVKERAKAKKADDAEKAENGAEV